MPRSGKHDGQNCGSNDGAEENQCVETTGHVPNRPRDFARKLANPVGARMAVRKCCCHGKGAADQKDGYTGHSNNNCCEDANTQDNSSHVGILFRSSLLHNSPSRSKGTIAN